MPTVKLTQLGVERLKPPAPGQRTIRKDKTEGAEIQSVTYWDTLVPGFGLRVSVKGRKTWTAYYRVNGKAVMETIGTLATIPKVDVARDMARASMVKAKAGTNAVEEKRQQEAAAKLEAEAEKKTFSWLIEHVDRGVNKGYLEQYAKRRQRPSTLLETKRILKRVMPYLGDKLVKGIKADDITQITDAVAAKWTRKRRNTKTGSNSEARTIQAHLNSVFHWAFRAGHIEINPMLRIERDRNGDPGKRDRVLSETEIQAFWIACNELGYPYGPIGQLLLLTAQRQGQVSGMCRSELDLRDQVQEWTLPAERTKNGEVHIVPLTAPVINIIESLPALKGDLLFSMDGKTPVRGFPYIKEKLDAIMRRELATINDNPDFVLKPWVWHDLRRTAKTEMSRLRIRPHISARVLGHTMRGLEPVYDRYDYLTEKREALAQLASRIDLIVGRGDNVVPLRGTA